MGNHTKLDQAFQRLKSFSPRRKCPTALKVQVDGKEVTFPIDPATGMVSTLPKGVWGWVVGFQYEDLAKYFEAQKCQVEMVQQVLV